MGLPQVVTLGPGVAAASANLLAHSQTPVSGTPLTLTGSQPDVPREVLLTYGNEASARTMVITGTNSSGDPIQQTLAVPSGAGGTVATTLPFATVTSALPLGDDGWTAAVTLGTDGVMSPWKIVDIYGMASFSWSVVAAGTVNWSIELTNDDPNNRSNLPAGAFGNYPVPPAAYVNPTSGLVSQTGSANGSLAGTFYAWRLRLNSGGTGAADYVTATMIQAGLPIR